MNSSVGEPGHMRRVVTLVQRRPFCLWVPLVCGAAGLLSVAMGADDNWDLLFYHLYAPFAYLHGRYLYDVGPAQAQGFFNPTADFLFYGLISSRLNDYPRVIAFIMGAVHGINAVLVLAIACHVLRPARMLERTALRASAFLMGVSGVGFVSLLGLTTNDLINSMFMLGSLLVLLEVADEPSGHSPWRGLAGSGLLAGIGIGLKYTVVVFLPALGLIGLIIAVERRSIRGPVAYGVAVIIGFSAAAGHHLFTLWHTFGNPTFPFLNNIFRSPYYDPVSLLDTQFMPRDFWQVIAYPFYWTRINSYVVTELPFRDWRGAIAYVAILAGLAAFGVRHWRGGHRKNGAGEETRGLAYLFLFVIVSCFVWERMFGMYRYGVTLEMLTGVATMGALVWIFDSPRRRIAAGLAMLALAATTTVYLDWGHRPYGAKYVDVRVPPLPPKSDVLVATWDPVSYFIPFAEPSAHYLGIDNNYLDLTQHNKLVDMVRRGMATPGTAKFVLSVGKFDSGKLNKLLRNFGLRLSPARCEPIVSTFEGLAKPLSLCRALAD